MKLEESPERERRGRLGIGHRALGIGHWEELGFGNR